MPFKARLGCRTAILPGHRIPVEEDPHADEIVRRLAILALFWQAAQD